MSSAFEMETLHGMINSLRVYDLGMLVNSVEKTGNRRKADLQTRAHEILNNPPPGVSAVGFKKKIQEIFAAAQQSQNLDLSRPQQQMNTMQQIQLNNRVQQHYAPSQRPGMQVANAPPPYHPPPHPNAAQMARYQQPYYNNYNSQNMQNQLRPAYATIAPSPPPFLVPNVKFKKMPFYEIIKTIIEPTALVPSGHLSIPPNKIQNLRECNFQFKLLPEICEEIACNRDIAYGKNDFNVLLQLRFCAYTKEGGIYDDMLPVNLFVRLNGKYCPMPPIVTAANAPEQRRQAKPTYITIHAKLSPKVTNTLIINWTADLEQRNYAVTLVAVRKLSYQFLLERVHQNSVIPSEITKEVIINRLKVNTADDDDVVATTTLLMPLICPLGAKQMKYPAKGKLCLHIQFFDAENFICLNEKRPAWTCPICSKPLIYDDLEIYQYVLDVLNSNKLPADCVEVELLPDGTWNACDVDHGESNDAKCNGDDSDTVEMIDDDDDDTQEIVDKCGSVEIEPKKIEEKGDDSAKDSEGGTENSADSADSETVDNSNVDNNLKVGISKVVETSKDANLKVVDLTTDDEEEEETEENENGIEKSVDDAVQPEIASDD